MLRTVSFPGEKKKRKSTIMCLFVMVIVQPPCEEALTGLLFSLHVQQSAPYVSICCDRVWNWLAWLISASLCKTLRVSWNDFVSLRRVSKWAEASGWRLRSVSAHIFIYFFLLCMMWTWLPQVDPSICYRTFLKYHLSFRCPFGYSGFNCNDCE